MTVKNANLPTSPDLMRVEMKCFNLVCLVVLAGSIKGTVAYTTTPNVAESSLGQRLGHAVAPLEDGHTLATVGGFNVLPSQKSLVPVEPLAFFNTTSYAWHSPASSQELARIHFIFNGPITLEERTYYVVFGGQNSTTRAFCNQSVQLLRKTNVSANYLQLEDVSATPLTALTPRPRILAAGTLANNEMYMFGGELDQDNDVINSAYPFSDELFKLTLHKLNGSLGVEWHMVHASADFTSAERPVARSGHSFDAIDNSTIVLFGGKHYNYGEPGEFQGRVEYLEDTWLLHLREVRWMRLITGSTHPARRAGHASAVRGELLFVHGGFSLANDDFVVYDDLWVLKKNVANVLEWGELHPTSNALPKAWHVLVASAYTADLFIIGGLTLQESTTNFSVVDHRVSSISGMSV